MSWREKFRRGHFGVWGALEHVQDGVAELRIVDREGKTVVVNTTLSSIGRAEAGDNTTGEEQSTEARVGAEEVSAVLLEEPTDAVVVKEAKVAFPGVVAGPHCLPVKGSGGRVARIKAIEGLWEQKRGHKVGGGERLVRRAKTLVARRRRGIKAA
jgi:putative component of toxin-antitoxin plasmid stabilization module